MGYYLKLFFNILLSKSKNIFFNLKCLAASISRNLEILSRFVLISPTQIVPCIYKN